MVARTSSGSGLFSEVVGNCVNGDTFTIQSGHNVTVDVDLSTLTTGLGASTINGVMDFKADINTGLFMNGNLDVNGALYVANRVVVSGFTLKSGKSNVYEVARTLNVATVEETLGNGYKNAIDELTDLAVSIENYRLHTLYQPEMMADVVKEFRISYRNSLTLTDVLNYVESNPNVFYHDTVGNKLYIHTSDSSNPSSKTITVIEPINRPASGIESRCNIKFNATGVISNTGGGTPVIAMYGWYPSREYTQLDTDAALNDTTIVLKEDLGLQAGDKIVIGSGTENNGVLVESQKGIYVVQSYNAGTKIVTLTGGLGTARLNGDYVEWASAPIKYGRTSGSAGIIATVINDLTFVGVLFTSRFISVSFGIGFPKNWTFKHCKFSNYGSGLHESLFEDCNFYGVANYWALLNAIGITYNRCIGIAIEYDTVNAHYNSHLNNCIFQNIYTLFSAVTNHTIFKNCTVKNAYLIGGNAGKNTLINCSLSGLDNLRAYPNDTDFIGCVFKDNNTGYLHNTQGKLDNCLFEGINEISSYNGWYKNYWQVLESFDHNQIPGQYKAWCKGGRIETIEDKLKFITESSDYPVFRDYPILAPSNRTIKFRIGITKDNAEILTKLQIIDPTSDPLIDPQSTPLAETTATNTTEAQQIGVAYKSSTPRQLILRILCQDSMGNVLVDTTRIDQSLAKRIN
ncbi:MAG: hypothetical protein Q8M06_11850 [Methanobacteriaceae archaeon]|nr:hypothetical protein [Methanobacteriaceae archaeon]